MNTKILNYKRITFVNFSYGFIKLWLLVTGKAKKLELKVVSG